MLRSVLDVRGDGAGVLSASITIQPGPMTTRKKIAEPTRSNRDAPGLRRFNPACVFVWKLRVKFHKSSHFSQHSTHVIASLFQRIRWTR